MRTETDFSGLWIPLVTPFRKGRVDHIALAALVEHLGGCGVAGFVACGSTGEAAALDSSEQLAVLDVEGFPVERSWVFAYPIGKQLPVLAQGFMDFTRKVARTLVFDHLSKS